MEQMRLQAEHVGTRLVSDHIVEAHLDERPFRLIGDSGKTYTCDALIIATGAKAKWLGLPSEERFKGFGVSACATCDGFFFRGKKVLVVGGGNTAVEEALYLSNLASHVTIIHRRDEFRSERVLVKRLLAQENVSILFNHVIDEIVGDENPLSVTGARVKNVSTGAIHTLAADGVFVAIGHSPASELFRGQLTIKAVRLYRRRAGNDAHQHSGRLRRRRRRRRGLSSGGDGGGTWLHGGARSREISARRADDGGQGNRLMSDSPSPRLRRGGARGGGPHNEREIRPLRPSHASRKNCVAKRLLPNASFGRNSSSSKSPVVISAVSRR